MSALNGSGSDSALEPRRPRAAGGGAASRQGVETVLRHLAEIEPRRREPPAHLQGALRAAAAARDRAERIRGVAPTPAPEPAIRPPPAPPGRDAWSDPVAPADPPGEQPSDQTRFARTSAAAQQVRAAIAAKGADVPLHLRLREEEGTPERRTRWLSRLLGALGTRARPASERLSLPGPQGAQPLPETAESSVAGLEVLAPRGGAAAERPAIAGTDRPDAEAALALPEVLRLPPLGRGELDAPLSPPMDPPGADPDRGGPYPQRPAGAQAPPAAAATRLEVLQPPLSPPWLAHQAVPRALNQLAWAIRWRSASSGPAQMSAPLARTARHLPVPYAGAQLPARRLADVLGQPHRPSGGPWPGRADDVGGARRAASSAAAAFTASRSSSRWLMLTGALAAGFALGASAYGSFTLSGTRWGQALLALDTMWFELSRPDGAAPAPGGGPASTAASPAPPATGDPIDWRAERRSGTSSTAAAERPAALPETRPPRQASTGYDPEAGSRADARGPVDFGLSSRATAAAPATLPAALPDWESLYAEGHRYQLAGNLVAAADAYRRALGLNPQHAAIHYDLGYVLQMQGQAEAAVDHYRRAVALQPDHGYAHYNLGYLLQALGDSSAALEHYELAAARLPDNAFVYYDWGWSLEVSGDRVGAAALYRKAIALGPEDRPGIDARRRLAALGRSARLE